MKKLFYATKNKFKIQNMKDRLKNLEIELITPYDIQISIDVNEDGNTVIENAILKANAYYKGRLDSPAIGKLKSSAKIKVFYKYGGAYTEYFTAGNSLTNKNKSGRPQMYFGWTTDTGALAPDTRFQTTQNQAPSHLPNIVINKTQVSNGATYSSNINIECQTEPFEANASTRLTWYVSSNIEAGWKGGNGNFWLYLDDIRVSIAQ